MKPQGGGGPSRPAPIKARQIESRSWAGSPSSRKTFSQGRCHPVRLGLGLAGGKTKDGKLAVTSTPNQDSPLHATAWTPLLGPATSGSMPTTSSIRTSDPDYIAAWWNTVNWDEVNRRLSAV